MLSRIFIYSLLILLLAVTNSSAQINMAHEFSMNDCTMTDSRGGLDGTTFGLSCACGVNTNGLSFPGNSGFAQFDQELNDLIQEDWSLSFYIQIKNQGNRSVDILFLGERCGLDSVLSLRYLPGTQEFRFLLSDSPNNAVELDAALDRNSCWQYVVITKVRANVKLYINGVLASEESGRSDFGLNVDGILSISDSPCQSLINNADAPLEGVVDEFRIFRRALTPREIGDSFLKPDKIITNDTTIFVGSSIMLLTGGTCHDDFVWTPASFLNDPLVLNPIATPDENITYTLTVNGQNCSSIEQVNIRVADESVVSCEDLLLPSAFTPNDDRINDQFGISNTFLINDLRSFEIFNRWGGRVFFTNDKQGQWNGTYQGNPAPPTSYVYKVVYQCDNELITKTGTINLIR